jgi:hypothetical protein
MEIFVKATALCLAALLTTSAQAFADPGHVPVAGGAHAVQHVAGDWLFVAMTLIAVGAGTLIAARITRRGR